MNKPIPKAQTLTNIMLAVFRLNRRLLDRGDELVETLGINSARWQLLGAVSLAGRPLSAPQIAEVMGVTRQGAQKQLTKMVAEGYFAPQPNPRHERSPIYALTKKGQRAFEEAMAREGVWATALAKGLAIDDLTHTLNILAELHQRLESLPTVQETKA